MTTPTVPFVTEQCCVATLCYPEPKVTKRASTAPKCVMPGDKFAITYAIGVTRSEGRPTLTFIANYTLHNPTTELVSVPVTITLLDGTTPLTTYTQKSIDLDAAPINGPYTTKEITVADSFPLTTECSGKYSLQFSVADSSATSCSTTTCNLNITCPPPQCYCLTDVTTTTGVTYSTGHVFETGVIHGKPLMFPINVCFADGITQKNYTYSDLYTVTECPVTISNTAILSSTDTDGECTNIGLCNILNVSTIIIPTITCNTPKIKCDVTVKCVPKVCMCKTASVLDPTSVEIHTNFTVDLVCKTCLSFTVTDYCAKSKNFTYTVSSSSNTTGSPSTPIVGFQNISFNPETTVEICTPKLVIPEGTMSLIVLVTFTSPANSVITIPVCVSIIPKATVANVCLSECISIIGTGGGSAQPKYGTSTCTDDTIVRNILRHVLADNCMASIKLSLDDLAALDSCGLNYTLDISELCGNSTITTTSSLTIGGGDDCNSPAITDSSTTHTQHTQKTITYISLPPCPTTNAVGRSSIHNPLYKLKYIGE